MKIFLIGDLHFGVHVNSLKWLNTQKNFFYEWLIPYIRENSGPDDVVVQLGDVFENKHFLNVNIFKNAMLCMRDLAEVLPVHVILGNHDVYYLHDNTVNSIRFLQDLNDNTTVYEKPQIVNFGGVDFTMMPWITDAAVLEREIRNCGSKYLFAHMDVKGMKYDNNRPISHGVPMSCMSDYKRVYSGHIHTKQESGNLIYTGMPYQTTRSDMGREKGIHVLTVEGGVVADERFVRNDSSPVFKRFDVYDVMDKSIEDLRAEFANSMVDVMWESGFAKKYNNSRFVETIKANSVEYESLEFPPYTAGFEEEVEKAPDNFDIRDIGEAFLKRRGYNHREVNESMAYFDDLEMRLYDSESLKTR